MFRLKLALIVIGGVIIFFGFQEFRVSSGTRSQPQTADLAALETGQDPENPHVEIGEHTAIYGASVYEYEASSFNSGEPGPNVKVNHSYYPIISPAHAFNVRWEELSQQYGGYNNVPETEDLPDLNTFAVLVKTKRFKTLGAIPDGAIDEPSIKGLFVNRISSLDSEERKLVRESFPMVNVEQLLILEQDRKPSSIFFSLAIMGGGLVVSLLGLGWMILGAASSQ